PRGGRDARAGRAGDDDLRTDGRRHRRGRDRGSGAEGGQRGHRGRRLGTGAPGRRGRGRARRLRAGDRHAAGRRARPAGGRGGHRAGRRRQHAVAVGARAAPRERDAARDGPDPRSAAGHARCRGGADRLGRRPGRRCRGAAVGRGRRAGRARRAGVAQPRRAVSPAGRRRGHRAGRRAGRVRAARALRRAAVPGGGARHRLAGRRAAAPRGLSTGPRGAAVLRGSMVGVSRAGSRHHVAVVEGPDGGWVAPLPEDRAVVVGRAPDADLPLADPDLSRHHLALRDRRGRLQARALTGRVVRLRRARRRRSGRVVHARGRRLQRRWRPVPVGSRLVAGGTVLEVRPHPGLAPPAEATPSPDLGEGLGLRLLVPLAMAASMVPLALTSAASSPWRAVTWVVLPLALVAAVVWPWWRQRAARRRSHPEPPPPAPPPDPAGLLAAADHPWRREVDLLDAGWAGHGRRARHRTVAVPDPGHAVAVVGPSEAARAMVRWLLCQLVHAHPPEDLAVVVPPGWDWAAPLPHTATSASASRVVVVEAAAGGAPALPRDAVALVVAPSLAQVPPGCAEVVEVSERHDRTVGTAW